MWSSLEGVFGGWYRTAGIETRSLTGTVESTKLAMSSADSSLVEMAGGKRGCRTTEAIIVVSVRCVTAIDAGAVEL